MKLLRHGPIGEEKPGALDADGQARDLSLLVPDFTPEWMAPAKLEALKAIDLTRMPLVPTGDSSATSPSLISIASIAIGLAGPLRSASVSCFFTSRLNSQVSPSRRR